MSPSGRYVLLTVAERVEGQQQTMVPFWVTESGYTEPMNVRTKVGDVEGVDRAAVLDLQTQRLTWVPAGQRAPRPQGHASTAAAGRPPKTARC